MPNALYTAGKQALLTGQLAWGTDDIRAILVDTADYTVDLANHDALNDVPVAARASIVALTGETAAAGAADADDTTFPAVPLGDVCEAVILYKHTGTEATSTLLVYIDTATGLPVTPNGGNVVVTWDSGVNKIFRL